MAETGRLTLTRKTGEWIDVGDAVRVEIREVRGNRVMLTVVAPADVPIRRSGRKPLEVDRD